MVLVERRSGLVCHGRPRGKESGLGMQSRPRSPQCRSPLRRPCAASCCRAAAIARQTARRLVRHGGRVRSPVAQFFDVVRISGATLVSFPGRQACLQCPPSVVNGLITADYRGDEFGYNKSRLDCFSRENASQIGTARFAAEAMVALFRMSTKADTQPRRSSRDERTWRAPMVVLRTAARTHFR